MKEPKEKERSKDWISDFTHENGNYTCRCMYCKEKFIGHKRRAVCFECSNKQSVKEHLKQM